MKRLLWCLVFLSFAGVLARAQNLADTWQGTLPVGKGLRTVLKITKVDAGYKAEFYSIDQSPQAIPVSALTLQAGVVKFSMTPLGASYEGKLSPDGKTITGTFTQGGSPFALVYARATPETEWSMPKVTVKVAPMAADANPSFEVATIKPSAPDVQGRVFTIRGRQFLVVNSSLVDLIAFVYGVQAKQVLGGPAWISTDKFDLTGQPDAEGAPSEKQWKEMLKKLMADRFQLKFHTEKKELAVYVLSAGRTGPKLTKSQGDPNGLPGLGFQRLGGMSAQNANMGDLASLFQSVVLDRPVLNQTGLAGRYDFTLNWTPDGSQFGGLGVKVPPPSDAANAPPNLFTAIGEQLGLKLEATRAQAEVMVIDRAEKASGN